MLTFNDIHSQLNLTQMRRHLKPASLAELQEIVRDAAEAGGALAVAGGRHAMGGQQFAAGETLLDTSRLNRVLHFDPAGATVEVEAGIEWTKLIEELSERQRNAPRQFSIIQKQTGANRLSIGGALAANAHGRGLRLKPLIGDVESFTLVDASGEARRCSREENYDLFRLCIGGYGLFGIIARVRLRLAPRRKLQRTVEITDLTRIAQNFDERLAEDFEYGDFQFMTDSAADGFMHAGLLSCYRPIADDTPLSATNLELSEAGWGELLYLAHADRAQAFRLYAQHYLATHNQIYYSDTHQLSVYLDDYHREIDRRTNADVKGSEMITEAYVPRESLTQFMETMREDFRRHSVDFIYGTIRLIERDDESYLAWAREDYACVIFNLHVRHDADGLAKAQADFRRIIDRAIEMRGSFYLTYHAWATREQVLACYPQFPQFLCLKRQCDPRELFQSDWYRHYKMMFAEELK